MTSRPAAQSGFELIWVNASPTGPTAVDASESTQHRITRVQPGQKKLVTRSIPARGDGDDTIVNDLAHTITFHFAKTVSRQHAEIDWNAGTPFVKDIGSTHGTFVARRHADFGPDGQMNEQDASAQLVQVTGIMKLRHGDLIQFGKALSRDSTHFNPVRCYVRFRDATPPRSSSSIPVAGPASVSSAKPSCSYGLDDASLDSDVINIDAETFHKGASPVDFPLPETIDSKTQRNTLSPHHVEPAEVEIASSDSEQSCVSVDHSESDCHDVVDCTHSDSESSCGCPERHENELFGSGNVSADDSDLPISIDDDDEDGKCATSGASASSDEEQDSSTMDPDQVDPAICVLRAPGTDVHIDKTEESVSPIQESASVAPTASSTSSTDDGSQVALDGELKPAAADESSSEAENTEMPVSETIVVAGQKVEAQLTPSRKRALDTPGSDRASTHDSIGDEDDGDTDSDKSFEASSVSALSSPCTSVSGSPSPPPPAKKRRISNGSHEDRRSQPRPSSRGRRIRVFAGKALYTASLLSIGFFSGSLFTFKSMLNAAAAANANISDRQ